MAIIYVKSGAANSSPFASWANAATTLAGASGVDTAGDTIYVSSSHAESSASAQTIALAGTLANPVRIIGVNDSAEPPTAEATGASVTTTLGSLIGFTGVGAFVKNIDFNVGSGNNAAAFNVITTNDSTTVFDTCNISLVNTSTSSTINFGGSAPVRTNVKLESTNVKFGNASQKIGVAYSNVTIKGGSLLTGGTSPTFLINPVSSTVTVSGFDLSNAAAGINLCSTFSNNSKVTFRNCKLPASWSGTPGSVTAYGGRIEVHNCDSTDTNYRLWVEDYAGAIQSETTIVRTGGASDGMTDLSWRIVSSANANYPTIPLVSPEIVIWNATTGSSKTVTVEIIRDSATSLTNAEIWLEVQYLGTSGYPISTFTSDKPDNLFSTATNQTTSSATWTTTGMTNPNKQKLEVTFTPQDVGYIIATVHLAKPSTTVYVDPLLTVA